MKILFILPLLLIITIQLHSQEIGISGGYCMNHFFDLQKEDSPHIATEYENGSGYRFNIILDKIYLDTLLFRFSLNFTKYDGSFMAREGGLGGSSTTEAYINKYLLGLAIYPINIKIFKELRINIGGEFSYLVKSDIKGSRSSWNMSSGSNYIDLESDSIDIFKEFHFGIVNRIGYNFKLFKQWYLVPEYNFYLGLTREFDDIDPRVFAYRHFFMLGIISRLK